MTGPVYDFTAGYHAALERTPPAGPGGDAHVERFKDFLASLTESSIRQRTAEIYAPDAYLNDNLNEVRGAKAIEDHLVESLVGLSAIDVVFHDTACSNGDYYLRWTMSTTFRSLRGGAKVVTSGITHARFDSEGRVALHRDFWDAATGVYEHIPLLGAGIRAIKRRITGK